MWTALALVALGFAGGAGFDALGQPRQRAIPHRGQAIESGSRAPVEASVKAWPQSTRTGIDGNCPVYGTAPLDTVTSDKGSGMFTLSVDQDKRTYTVTYCSNGFVPRVDTMPNREGLSVIPSPAFLWRDTPGASARLEIEVPIRIIAVLNDLAYLRTVDQSRFDGTVERLSGDFSATSDRQAAVIRSIPRLLQDWGGPPAR
jgi:hypothetical protein